MVDFTNFLNISEFTEEKINKINKSVSFVLIIIISFILVKILMMVLDVFLDDFFKNSKQFYDYKKTKTTAMSYDIIPQRNIFNSKNEIPDDEVGGQDFVGKKTTLPFELVGTIVVNDSSRSVAAILLKEKKEIEPFVPGDRILEQAEVININRNRVVIKNLKTNDLEYIELVEEGVEIKTTKVSNTDSGIRQISETEIVVDRSEVDKAMKNINKLLMEARAVPYREQGQMAGFRLLGIKSDSLFRKLGAKNGDVIQEVNGVQIKDPATAMQLYQQLQTNDKFDIKVKRGGEDKTFTVNIR
jgi:type II secretion system protein C